MVPISDRLSEIEQERSASERATISSARGVGERLFREDGRSFTLSADPLNGLYSRETSVIVLTVAVTLKVPLLGLGSFTWPVLFLQPRCVP